LDKQFPGFTWVSFVNAATVALVFFSVVDLRHETAGFSGCKLHASLVSPTVLGLLHTRHFVMLPVLGGMLLLLDQHAHAVRPIVRERRLLAWRGHEATRDIFPSSP
jgi:hypothetical protein